MAAINAYDGKSGWKIDPFGGKKDPEPLGEDELKSIVALPQPTVHRYLNLLELSYQLIRVPAYSVNRTKRLIKTPKLYWADTGLAMHLSGAEVPSGAHLENLDRQVTYSASS